MVFYGKGGVIGLALLAGAAQAAESVVVTWNAAALEEVRQGKLGPPIVARALAIAHTCMYDAWAPYDTVAAPLASPVPRRPVAEVSDANKQKAVSYAAYRCLLNLFPAGQARLDAQMAQLGYDPSDTGTNPSSAAGVGNQAAAAVIESRRRDGSNQYGDLAPGAYSDYTGYLPRNGPMPFCLPGQPPLRCELNVSDPQHWQPLTSDTGSVQTFIAPHWERVTPFALSAATQYDTLPEVAAGPRYAKSAADYQADVAEMIAYSAALNPDSKLIIEYWADGPASELPPGHWGLLAQSVARRDWNPATSLDRDVKMFFAMHNASFDAGIVAWHLKRRDDGVRPITAVRVTRQLQPIFAWGGPGQPSRVIDGGKWTPYNPGSNLSPAFPGWVSGHSTFSAASATALRNFTGSDALDFSTIIPANFGRVEPGVPPVPTEIRYPTFSSAVSDAGLSRLLGGIHFSDDNTIGQTLGNLAGQQAYERARFLWEGGLQGAGSSQAASPSAQVLSWSHAVFDGRNRLLLVGVATTNADAVRSVTYGGAALTRVLAQNDTAADNRIEVWSLLAPPVGRATLQVTLNFADDVVAGAGNFRGVHQGTPFGSVRSAAGSGNGACVTLAAEPAPLVAAFVAANGDAGGVKPQPGLTAQWSGISDPAAIGASDVYGVGSIGASVPQGSVCHQLDIGRRWAAAAVPLWPAVSGPAAGAVFSRAGGSGAAAASRR